MDEKRCCTCMIWKPLEDFGKHKNRPDGRKPDCLECSREANKKYRSTAKGAHANNMANIWSRYKLTEGQLQDMLNWQRGACKICEADLAKGQVRYHIDHHHESGYVRGLLCGECNLMLGPIEKIKPSLPRVAAYLGWDYE